MTKQIKTTTAQLEGINAAKAAVAAGTIDAKPAKAEKAPEPVVAKALLPKVTGIIESCVSHNVSGVESANAARLDLIALAELDHKAAPFDAVWPMLASAMTTAGIWTESTAKVSKSFLRRIWTAAAAGIHGDRAKAPCSAIQYVRGELQEIMQEQGLIKATGAPKRKDVSPVGGKGAKAPASAPGKSGDVVQGVATVQDLINVRGGASVGDMQAMLADIKKATDKRAALAIMAEIEDMLADLASMGVH